MVGNIKYIEARSVSFEQEWGVQLFTHEIDKDLKHSKRLVLARMQGQRPSYTLLWECIATIFKEIYIFIYIYIYIYKNICIYIKIIFYTTYIKHSLVQQVYFWESVL